MNICVTAPWYPVGDETKYVFVEQLVKAFVRLGHKCIVVVPYNTYFDKKRHFPPEYEEKNVDQINKIVIYRPRYWNRNIPVVPISSAYYMASRAFEKVIISNDFSFDCIYCHFFIPATIAWPYAHKHNVPLLVATGESSIPQKLQKSCFSFTWKKFRKDTCGVVCVSTKNLDECIGLKYADKSKCGVFPNAIDNSRFKKLDKEKCRKQLGIPDNKFVVAFVGWFSERKGASRVAEAIDKLNDDSIGVLFIGQKQKDYDVEPLCKNIIFKGAVPHNDVPIYLNAADIFVLPTLKEGCCNSIIEALACGMPVISSDLPFNYDVLNENNSLLVDPNNVDAIREAICKLKSDDDLRNKLSLNALFSAGKLTLNVRASSIVQFIESKIRENNEI